MMTTIYRCKVNSVKKYQGDTRKVILSLPDGKDLNFSDGEEMLGNKGIVCASSFYHGQIIDTIKELRLNQ